MTTTYDSMPIRARTRDELRLVPLFFLLNSPNFVLDSHTAFDGFEFVLVLHRFHWVLAAVVQLDAIERRKKSSNRMYHIAIWEELHIQNGSHLRFTCCAMYVSDELCMSRTLFIAVRNSTIIKRGAKGKSIGYPVLESMTWVGALRPRNLSNLQVKRQRLESSERDLVALIF